MPKPPRKTLTLEGYKGGAPGHRVRRRRRRGRCFCDIQTSCHTEYPYDRVVTCIILISAPCDGSRFVVGARRGSARASAQIFSWAPNIAQAAFCPPQTSPAARGGGSSLTRGRAFPRARARRYRPSAARHERHGARARRARRLCRCASSPRPAPSRPRVHERLRVRLFPRASRVFSILRASRARVSLASPPSPPPPRPRTRRANTRTTPRTPPAPPTSTPSSAST